MTSSTLAVVETPVSRFARALAFLHAQGFRGRDFIRAAEPGLRRLLMEPDLLPEEATRPDPGKYARHLLHRDPQDRFVIAAMVWLPGQGTPVHDHDGSWGILGMVRGGLEVTNYFPAAGQAEGGEVELRGDPPHRPRAGEGDCICGCADIHKVTNPLQETAVSIHVYPKDLEKCRVFRPLDERTGRFEARSVALAYTYSGGGAS